MNRLGWLTVRDICCKGVKDKRPGHRVGQCFFELIQLEVLVADALLVDPHSLHGQDTVFLLQPAGIKLIIRNQPVEPHAQRDGQEARKKKDGFPWCDGRANRARSYGNAVCDQPAKDLSPAVEGEPDVDAGCLFVFGVPLQQLSVCTLLAYVCIEWVRYVPGRL